MHILANAASDMVRPTNSTLKSPVYVGQGYCSTTVSGWQGDCENGLIGTWQIVKQDACIDRCMSCKQCAFISFSKRNSDCSWFNMCVPRALGQLWDGAQYATYQVRRAAPATKCRGNSDKQHPIAAASQPEPGVHLVTFYSEGGSKDHGMPLGEVASVLKATFAPYVDSYRGYTPTKLLNTTIEWGKEPPIWGGRVVRPSKVAATMNMGLSAIGHLAAKPFAILHRLLSIPQGDLLLFKDANILKRPNLLAGAAEVRHTVAWTMREAAPAQDVFIPFENEKLKLKHHCKSYAIRTLAPETMHTQLFESPLHHSCQLVARRTPRAEALLWEWLQACLRKEMLEELPNPMPHPDYRWHTHEQCMFSIVSALMDNEYTRRLWFCWTWEPASVRELPPSSTDAMVADPRLRQPCREPDSTAARRWLPSHANNKGRCLAVECPGFARRCDLETTMFPWIQRRPGQACTCTVSMDN